jgi:hypothetical protein
MQQEPLFPVLRRDAEGTPIPYDGMKAGVTNATRGRLRRKRYLNTLLIDIHAILPALVETASRIITGKAP